MLHDSMPSDNIRRILMTTDTVGGVWTYALEMAHLLQENQVQVALAAMGRLPDESQLEELEKLGNVTLFSSSYKLEWMEDPWEEIHEAEKWLRQICADFRPDLVHLNQFTFGQMSFGIPKLVVGHSCIYSWYESVKKSVPDECWNTYRKNVTRGLTGANAVTAPSFTMLKYLKKYYGNFKSMGAVYNCRSLHSFSPAVKKENLVVSAGRLWDEAKNIKLLADAAEHINAPVCIAGEDVSPAGEAMRFQNVNITGKLSYRELADILSRASIFVSPARYEPFGLSILEAALSGCALVLGDIPSLRELWDDAAIFIKPDDGEALTENVNRLIEDEQLCNMYREKARQRAECFKPARTKNEYMWLYNQILQES